MNGIRPCFSFCGSEANELITHFEQLREALGAQPRLMRQDVLTRDLADLELRRVEPRNFLAGYRERRTRHLRLRILERDEQHGCSGTHQLPEVRDVAVAQPPSPGDER